MASRLISSVFALLLISVCPLMPASAIPITVSFTVNGFGVGAPTDPVTGSIGYDATSTTSNINSLTSIGLTIAGHTYPLSDVSFISSVGLQLIGGSLNGVGTPLVGTDDFVIEWNAATLSPILFNYAVSSVPDNVFSSTTFPAFSVAAAAVPEPNSLLLLLVGVASLRVCPHIVRRLSTKYSSVVR